MRRFRAILTLAAVALAILIPGRSSSAETLRYTVTANVPGIVLGTLVPNCATNICTITMTGVGDTADVTGFPAMCAITPPCPYKGQGGGGSWNRSLTNVAVTVYDPISGNTYGPATFPSGFFVSFDNFNGGIGFGSDGYGGPAYPVSIAFGGGAFAYSFWELPSSYDLTAPALAGGGFDDCPALGLPCDNTPLPTIPVVMPDSSTVPLSIPQEVGVGWYWAQEEPVTWQWSAAAPMVQARSGHTATVMNNGKVLVVGGSASPASTTAEIYDPTADTWTATTAPGCGRTAHAATLLADGRVLVVGGTQCPTSAEAFNPANATWTTVATIPIPFAASPQVVRLQDGRVFVLAANGGEFWDPTTNTWSAASGMASVTGPLSALLPNGSVVVVDCANPQIFNPTANTWTAIAAAPGCSLTKLVATALTNNRVLLSGPGFGDSIWSVYYPDLNTWIGANNSGQAVDASTIPGDGSQVPLPLADGQILLVGGNAGLIQATATDPSPIAMPAPISPLFQPVGNSWATFPAPAVGRTGHAVVQLQNGRVLVMGGQGIAPASGTLSSVEQLPLGIASQTIINFYLPGVLLFGTSGTVSATATSGLPVSFATETPLVCTVSGTEVTAVGGGYCYVSASQAGNSTYDSATPLSNYFQVQPTAPAFSLAGGTYYSAQSLTLTDATPGVNIFYTYTAAGATPTAGSTLYSGAIPITSTGIVEAVAIPVAGGANSAVSSKAYVYSTGTPAAAPSFSLAGGTYHSPQTLTLTDATPGATIYYTTNGTTPTTGSTKYTVPITIASTELVEAVATASGFSPSPVSAKAYTYVPFTTAAAPGFSLAGGTYTTPQMLTLTDATPGAVIHYTTNGTTPNGGSTVYAGQITIASTELVEAIAIASGYNPSPVSAKSYTYSALPLAAAPSFILAGGHYTTPQMLTLTDATPGAVIHYTTNGTTPNASSTVYSGPIMVSTTELVEAIAVATGYSNSNVSSKAYTIP